MNQSGLKDRLAILQKSNLQSLPLIYMLKDKEGRFQFITDIAAQHTGAVSGDELINKALGDLKSEAATYASEFEYYDAMSKDQRSEVLLLSLIHSEKGADISLICNKPIINNKNEVEGVEIWVQVLPSESGLEKIIQGYQQVSIEKTLPRLTNSNILTLREQECVYYLTKGFTFREMANALNISPRTVETHVTNIKLKLNVNTRAELIVKVCELGYIQINPRNPDWKPGKLQLLSVKPCESLEEIL